MFSARYAALGVAAIILLGGAFAAGAHWRAEPAAEVAAVHAADVPALPLSEATTTPEAAAEPRYEVVKVVDGDTVALDMDGKSVTVRLIGIDTPETVDPRTAVQCFGAEASGELKRLLTGAQVRVEKDDATGEKDKYGRLLAYLYRDDGLFINEYLIAQGFGHEYTYDAAYRYQKEFRAAQAEAKAAQRGLWAPDACAEPESAASALPASAAQKTSAPVPEPQPQQQPPHEAVPQPQTEPEPAPREEPPSPPEAAPQTESDAQHPSYTCSSNTYNCGDFSTHDEAQAVYEMCGGAANDVHKLDSNKDGEACESLP